MEPRKRTEEVGNQGATLYDDLLAELRRLGVAEAEQALKEFDFLSISDEAEELPREMAKKVRDRIDGYARLLEDLIQPDSSLAAMNECGFFSEQEMGQVVKLYRRLMHLVRSHAAADLAGEQEKFLVAAIPAWGAEKAALAQVVERLVQGWKQDQPLQREKGYFG